MSIQSVREYFRARGMEERILEFPVSSATVELASLALGCEPCRIAKTLSFLLDGAPVLVVVAGDARIDNAKYRRFFGAKAKMIPADQVEALIGHAVGGVCPFAVLPGVKTYLDVSLRRFRTVFPACGSANSAIELSIPELEACADAFAAWSDVCKDPVSPSDCGLIED